MKSLIFISIYIFLAQEARAQAPDIIWQKSFGGSDYDNSSVIKSSADSGFYLLGDSRSNDNDIDFNFGERDIWLSYVSENGELMWEKTFGGGSVEYGSDLEILEDNKLLICGYTYSNDGEITEHFGNADYWLLNLNAAGSLEWEQSYGGSQFEGANSVLVCEEGGYMIVGDSKSIDGDVIGLHGSTNTDFWVIKLSYLGDIEWQKCFGSNNTEQPKDIVRTNDNGYIIVGTTYGEGGDVIGNHGSTDIWVIKIDSSGNLVWQKCLGGTEVDVAKKIINTSDGGYMIAGETYSNNGDVEGFQGGVTDGWIIKLDSNGMIEWQRCYGGTGGDKIYSLKSFSDSNYVFVASSTSIDGDVTINNGSNDCWVVKIDQFGEIIWQKSIGGTSEDLPSDIVEAQNGDVILLADTYSTDGDVTVNYGIWDFWVVRLGFCTTKYFADLDGDGYGDISSDTLACELPTGYVSDSTDCNDLNSEIHPTLSDVCNAIDDNCNGLTDEDATFVTYFADIDGDNFGDVLNDSTACNELIGYVLDNTDCNDTNNAIYPGATELCNYLDDDCDGITDDNVTFIQSFIDADNDNFGNPDFDSIACEIPTGYVLTNTDCNDTNPDIYPGAPELLNGLDDDCDLIADEGLAITDIVKNTISIFPNPVNVILFIQSDGTWFNPL